MTSRIAQVALDCADPAALARFWCAVLDWQVLEEEDDVVCIGPEDGGAGMDLIPCRDAKGVKNRLHLDLRADGISTEAELERLLALGARRADVGQPDDATWVVLADPEGNEFCLLSRNVQQVQSPEVSSP